MSIDDGSQFAVTVEEEKHISADIGELRQDRYPLRTSAQFLGPQVEDILSAFAAITIECNSSKWRAQSCHVRHSRAV